MGIQISDIIPRKEITLKDLKGKIIAIDAFNILYQFLTTIRQADGTPLMDSKGNITSHLSGIFYRTINLMAEGIKPVYVFDGKPPKLKEMEAKRRRELKEIAQEKYEKAKTENNVEDMKKYSSQTVKMTDEIVNESKQLLVAMGVPVIQAETEGEAEAAIIAKRGYAWASASQDYDSLLYETPRLIKNLTLARKRKSPSGHYVDTEIEMIEYQDVLDKLAINTEQLICLAILVGTDYNPGGVKGIGQKKALNIVQEYEFPVKIFEHVQNSDKYEIDFNWQEIFSQFKNFKGNHNEKLIFEKANPEKIKELLVKKHEFAEERIDSSLKKLEEIEEQKKQTSLKEYF